MSETADDNAVQEALQAQVDRLFGRIPEEDRTAAEKEAYREIEELAAAAADPTTPPERLTALFDEYIDRVNYPRGHVHFREREKAAREWLGPPLARHPNAPLKVLLELARYHPHDVVANPVFPLLPLEHPDLTEQFGARSLEHLLRCAGCPPAFVRLCADHANPDIRFAAREHIALTGEPDPFGTDWQEAALDGLMALRMSLPDDVYDLWETGWLPEPIAARFPTVPEPQLPEEFGLMERRIQKFARRTVQRAKGKAPSVPTKPDDGWETWAAELYRTNLKEAAAWAEDPDLPIDALHALAVTPDPKARKTKKNPHPPAPKEIRKALARNPACPAEVLDAVLIYDNCRNIAAHPNVTPEILERILEKFQYGPELSVVAASPKATPDLLRRLYDVTLDERFLYQYSAQARRLARHRIEQRVANGEPVSGMDAAAVRTIPPAAFHTITLRNGNPLISFVRYAMESPATVRREGYQQELRRRAEDGCWWYRFAMAVNPQTPEEFLPRLAEDGCRPVRAAARSRLADPTRSILGL
jgi:hypothetical protein